MSLNSRLIVSDYACLMSSFPSYLPPPPPRLYFRLQRLHPYLENRAFLDLVPIMHHQAILPRRDNCRSASLLHLLLIFRQGFLQRFAFLAVGIECSAEILGVVDGVVEALATVLIS